MSSNVKQLFVTVLNHLLELGSIVRLGRDGTVNIVLDDGDAILFAISWWASVVLAYNSLMVAVMGCMRIRLTGLYTASTTAASTTTTITARQPHGTCHAAPK